MKADSWVCLSLQKANNLFLCKRLHEKNEENGSLGDNYL